MTHTAHSEKDRSERPPPEASERAGERPVDAAAERPDRRGPRGNPDVEQIDVDRGQGKLERVLGW